MLALQALYYSYGSSVRLSVCHTPVLPKRLHIARCMQFALSDSKMSSFLETKKYSQGRPLPPEILAQTDLPRLITASLDTFCLVAPQR